MKIKFWTGSSRWPLLSSIFTTGKSFIAIWRPKTFSWHRAARSRLAISESLASSSTLMIARRQLLVLHTTCHLRSVKRSLITRSPIFGHSAVFSMKWWLLDTLSTPTRWRALCWRFSAEITQRSLQLILTTWKASLPRCWLRSLRSVLVWGRFLKSPFCRLEFQNCSPWQLPGTSFPTHLWPITLTLHKLSLRKKRKKSMLQVPRKAMALKDTVL